MTLAALILLAFAGDRQDCTTDASVARAMLRLSAHGLPGPDEIRVYDFINFFKHDLAEDYTDGPVSFDARLLRSKLPDGEAGALLQLGFRTARIERKNLRAMNIAVVIDRSGSMGDAKKMDYVKKALDVFVGGLREDDRLAIIVFDDKAELLMPSTAVSNPATIRALVAQIQPGGSTNLYDGLKLGFEEVEKGFDPKRTNKVLLLSDGMPTAGITDREKIVADFKPFNDKGIDLTAIGIGLDYNDVLMSQLAKAGHGDYHFLNDFGEIQRIFEQELQGLFERVARKVRVRVTPGPGVAVRAVYGYEFKIEHDAIVFEIDDMGRALTQILPIELAVSKDATLDPLVTAELTYDDADAVAKKSTRIVKAERLPAGKDAAADAGVLKHLTIARLALALREACRLTADQKPTMAADLLSAALQRVETIYGPVGKIQDKDLGRVLTMIVSARRVLGASQCE